MKESTGALDEIEKFCKKGQFLRAWKQGEELGDLEQWPGERGLLLASSIAAHLGAPKRSDQLDLRMFRRYPGSVRAWAQFMDLVLEQRGPLAAHERLQRYLVRHSEEKDRGEVCLIRAAVARSFRDFSAAEKALLEAEEKGSSVGWLYREWATLLCAQDRFSEAITKLEKGIESHPEEVVLRWRLGHLFLLLGRGDDALRWLNDAEKTVESAILSMQQVALLIEKEQHAQASELLQRIQRLAPPLWRTKYSGDQAISLHQPRSSTASIP